MEAPWLPEELKSSPHCFLLRGGAGGVRRGFDALRERGDGAPLIAGCFRRSLDVTHVSADASTRAVTVQTPTLFCDLRIAVDRPAVGSAGELAALPLETLKKLVMSTHCFSGYSAIRSAPAFRLPPGAAAAAGPGADASATATGGIPQAPL